MFLQEIFLDHRSFLQHSNSHILNPASTAQENAVAGTDQVFLLTVQCHFSDLKPVSSSRFLHSCSSDRQFLLLQISLAKVTAINNVFRAYTEGQES